MFLCKTMYCLCKLAGRENEPIMINQKHLPSFDKNRQILGKVLPLAVPFNVILDTSEACNFRCAYCFRSQEDMNLWGYARRPELMEWSLFCEAVEQIMAFPEDVKQISLSNHGEPLCNRKVPDMVRHIKAKEIRSRVSIHTNAALLTEDYAMDLADSNIDRIVVSLQGLSAEKYHEISGVHIDFDKFYHCLSVLYRHKRETQVCFKIADVALGLGEEERFYEMFSPIGDRVYVERIVPIWKGMTFSNSAAQKAANLQVNKYGEAFPEQKCCPLIFHTIVVTPSGDVYPCTQLLTPYLLGNIKKSTLSTLWNSDLRRELLVRQCKGNNPEICKDCFILQNSIFTEEDMIDAYRSDILGRL